MARPKILLAIPLLLAGTFLPAIRTPLTPLTAGVIGMSHEGYSKTVITIHTGDSITFQNNSRWIHVIGPGNDGVLATDVTVASMSVAAGQFSLANMGMKPRVMMQENETYTTAAWNVPGTYLITCTVHPEMNAKVVVTE